MTDVPQRRSVAAHHLLNFIDGRWTPAASGRTRTNRNPADLRDHLGEFAESDGADAERAVAAAAAALPAWRALGPIRRAAHLTALGRELADHEAEFTEAITREQGKLRTEARAEVARARAVLEFTAGQARLLGGVTAPAEEDRTFAYTFRRPLGVVGLVSPWNFPLAIPVWKVAPALLSGCTAVLKPSPLTPLTAALLTDAARRAGSPTACSTSSRATRPPAPPWSRTPRSPASVSPGRSPSAPPSTPPARPACCAPSSNSAGRTR